MKRKNNLDEMQEQKLLHIESKGYWLAFWGLGVSLIIQLIFYGPTNDWRYMAAEWIVFMAIALYMVAGCIKEGIWDRKLRPSFKDNIFMSLVAGVVMGVVQFVMSYRNYHKPVGSVAAGIFSGLMVMILCFIALTISSAIYKKRKEKLEEESEE